jgi:hypothetical protein
LNFQLFPPFYLTTIETETETETETITMNYMDKYSDDQSMYVPKAVEEKWIDVSLTFSQENYPSHLYDTYLEKIVHEYYGHKHPYQKGHLPYVQCPVCPQFMNMVTRNYSKLGDSSTQFINTLHLPENTILKMYVEEKRTNKDTVEVQFQATISTEKNPSILLNNHPVTTQDYLRSWMNSLLLELYDSSYLSLEEKEIEQTEKELESTMYDAMYFLRSSLY